MYVIYRGIFIFALNFHAFFNVMSYTSSLLCLLILQVRVAQTACMSACQHVAKSLMAMLLSEDVKQMSLAALEQVNLDVIQCERNYL